MIRENPNYLINYMNMQIFDDLKSCNICISAVVSILAMTKLKKRCLHFNAIQMFLISCKRRGVLNCTV